MKEKVEAKVDGKKNWDWGEMSAISAELLALSHNLIPNSILQQNPPKGLDIHVYIYIVAGIPQRRQ